MNLLGEEDGPAEPVRRVPRDQAVEQTGNALIGRDAATVADPLYVRTSGGYEMLTPERWTDVKEGRLKL